MAVVGAGIAGLTAAYRLQEQGFLVTVLESNRSPGGRMTETEVNGIHFNTGARLIYSFSPTILRLVDDLDLRGCLQPGVTPPIYVESGDKLFPAKVNPGLELMLSPRLTVAERARWFGLALSLSTSRFRFDPESLLSAEGFDHQTLEEYLLQKRLSQFSSLYVEPFFRGARCWRMSDVSPAFFAVLTAHMAGSTAYGLKGGIGILSQNLAQELDVNYGARVEKITRQGESNRNRIRYFQNGVWHELFSDLVICAVPGVLLSEMIHAPSVEELNWFKSIRYGSGGVVHYAFQKSVQPSVRFLDMETSPMISAIEHSIQHQVNSKYQAKVSVFLSPEGVDEVKRTDCEEQLSAFLAAELPDELQHLDSGQTPIVNQWIEHMLPIFYPGYLRALERYDKLQRQTRRQIYYCGDFMTNALVGGACRSGQDVSETINRHWVP